MLFNLWNFTPDYLSASDGMMIEDAIKSMEESEDAISEPVYPTVPIFISAPGAAANG